ncbi:hypothetical protein F5Y14DRAFT_395180 [Nemania sp. NC0429]|nr:hypothetical protein F5Y14DRAFT_395180 [Nemania sp. NC0429]
MTLLLTDLPAEILHHILGYVDPPDLVWIPRICKRLYHAVSENSALFKRVYLRHLDAPPRGPVDWERCLKDLVRLKKICGQDNIDKKKDELDFVHRAVTELLKNASTDGTRPGAAVNIPQSYNAEFLTESFASDSNQSAFLCRSFIYERARAEFRSRDVTYWEGPPKPEHQKSAHLHCLYGVPRLLAYPSALPQSRQNLMHPFACSKVYDLRQYTVGSKWGPFMNDGSMRVDWEKVEAVMIVLGANMRHLNDSFTGMCKSFCSVPFAGTWPHSWQPRHLSPSLAARRAGEREREGEEPWEQLDDPYGINGFWVRVVCFLDYSDFFAYNFSVEQPPPHIPRPSINVGQATRPIVMRMYVTSIEKPGPEDGQDLPVVHFKGFSKSLDQTDENADSDFRGIVRMTPEGEVRWTGFSIFGGVERWRSESVQIGGVKSAKGVLGHWFDKDLDPRGPAGPTAFWKIADMQKGPASPGSHLHAVLAEVDGIDNVYESDEDADEDDDNYFESDEEL